ncbi:hypothetical protein STVA_15610 [Allostella vacuolata]|nr:hypothetical protein STVA_15610 [Stella vacuolata]
MGRLLPGNLAQTTYHAWSVDRRAAGGLDPGQPPLLPRYIIFGRAAMSRTVPFTPLISAALVALPVARSTL